MSQGNPVSDRPLVIAIDGPAGAGKSTVTKQVAARLGLLYLDTGAMYRAATLAAKRAQAEDDAAITAVVRASTIAFNDAGLVTLNGEVVESEIRTPEITKEIYRIADNPACRAVLVAQQQALVGSRDTALEGRDATTVICPEATLKVYLDASAEERARRRVAEWQGQHADQAFAQVVADIKERDHRDSNRAVGALQQADDAMPLVTDGLSVEEVIARIVAWAIQRRPLHLEKALKPFLLVGRNREPGYVRVAEGSINDPPKAWKLGTGPIRTRSITRWPAIFDPQSWWSSGWSIMSR